MIKIAKEKKKKEPEEEQEKEDEEEEEQEEVKTPSEDLISKANAAAIRIEEANKVQAELLAKQTAMQVEKTLSGTAEAGALKDTKEEKEIESARKMLKGTGFEDQLFPKAE